MVDSEHEAMATEEANAAGMDLETYVAVLEQEVAHAHATAEANAAGMDLPSYIAAIHAEAGQAQEIEAAMQEELAYQQGAALYQAELDAHAQAAAQTQALQSLSPEELAHLQHVEHSHLAELQALGLV